MNRYLYRVVLTVLPLALVLSAAIDATIKAEEVDTAIASVTIVSSGHDGILTASISNMDFDDFGEKTVQPRVVDGEVTLTVADHRESYTGWRILISRPALPGKSVPTQLILRRGNLYPYPGNGGVVEQQLQPQARMTGTVNNKPETVLLAIPGSGTGMYRDIRPSRLVFAAGRDGMKEPETIIVTITGSDPVPGQ